MSTQFCIALGEGVQVSPAAYLAALRTAMENPTAKFRQSFQDPRGWMGPKTGAEIVQEYRRMIADRWASRSMAALVIGKGNRANRRVQVIRDAAAECKWCGQKTGATSKRFCDVSCARSYNS